MDSYFVCLDCIDRNRIFQERSILHPEHKFIPFEKFKKQIEECKEVQEYMSFN